METRSKKCPVCSKTDEVVPILYGYPSWEAREEEKAKKIHLGGCIHEENAPQFYCKRCEKKFGAEQKRE